MHASEPETIKPVKTPSRQRAPSSPSLTYPRTNPISACTVAGARLPKMCVGLSRPPGSRLLRPCQDCTFNSGFERLKDRIEHGTLAAAPSPSTNRPLGGSAVQSSSRVAAKTGDDCCHTRPDSSHILCTEFQKPAVLQHCLENKRLLTNLNSKALNSRRPSDLATERASRGSGGSCGSGSSSSSQQL